MTNSRTRRWSRCDRHVRRAGLGVLIASMALGQAGCGFRGLNSLPLPGTEGGGTGSYTIRAELPDVTRLQANSPVQVNDVTVGHVSDVERQGWHAMITMSVDGGVKLPANTVARVGQTSLLGSLHIELAPPSDVPAQGQLNDGAVIPLSSGGAFPTTEQTLAALSLVLNGGGLGKLQDVSKALSTAFGGREQDLRNLMEQLATFIGSVNEQTDDIIAATDSLNNLVAKFADQKPVLEKAAKAIPDALGVLKDQRQNLAELFNQLGKFGSLAADSVDRTKQNLIKELNDLGPVLQSLADAGPALTRSLDFFSTPPFDEATLTKWQRGDYANLTAVVDLTLSRLDAGLFTGTRWEGNLTELEMQWGRTVGQMPSPYTAGNPLVAPYHFDQGR